MAERGEILAEIRQRYANMFARVPDHVRNLYAELAAQRKLSRRLARDLARSRETAAGLARELSHVRRHDERMTAEVSEAHQRLLSVFTRSDNNDEILEEYHKLYGMRRSRLEGAVAAADAEKRRWVDAATRLALRAGAEQGVDDLARLHRLEERRLRATAEVIALVGGANEAGLAAIESKVEEWRACILKASQPVIDDDQRSSDTLARLLREMRSVKSDLAGPPAAAGSAAEPPADSGVAERPPDHPLSRVFHLYDTKAIAQRVELWAQRAGSVSLRFSEDRGEAFRQDIARVRKLTAAWTGEAGDLLGRNLKGASGSDYKAQVDALALLREEIEAWSAKLERRAAGGDGLASCVASLQTLLETSRAKFCERDTEMPMPAADRAALRDSLEAWLQLIATALGKAEPLHNAITTWMVQLVVTSGNERQPAGDDRDNDDGRDPDNFARLHRELVDFNVAVMKDSAGVDTSSPDGKDLRKVLL
ncbi:MAG: hypothetical protein BJ554DRAFT_6315 [Olpidium bornovanus]|uniref:Uncharacterized protein n=1 Tax=Olpidium bornovanus TaxID=278681 RepID=A0A8H8DKA8_9FUNG|nr:MAG: hypothetical protein BJ554DRAFT_6315 [Olpidium bornovanus]